MSNSGEEEGKGSYLRGRQTVQEYSGIPGDSAVELRGQVEGHREGGGGSVTRRVLQRQY